MNDIAVVFDTFAVLAYARGDVAPGELIVQVGEDERRVGIPATCLAQAVGSTHEETSTGRLLLLAALPAVSVLPLGPADDDSTDPVWRVGASARLVGGDVAVAHAAHEAVRRRAYYATARRGAAAAILPPGWPVLDVSR